MSISIPANVGATHEEVPPQRKSMLAARIFAEPHGGFWVVRHESGSVQAGWSALADPPGDLDTTTDDAVLDTIADRLRACLAGEPVDFHDVPLPSGTEFRRACWTACREIPRGRTLTYGELASAIGLPRSAARAVGQAMRHNPQPIITPCHRVLAQTGGLHGYAGSLQRRGAAVRIKQFLLDLEGARYDDGVRLDDTAAV